MRQPVELTGAGRTDAGVHAWGQVVSGDLPDEIDLADLARRVNKMCAPAIAVRARSGPTPTSTPGSRRPGATTGTTSGTTRRRTRCWRPGVARPAAARPAGRCRLACDPLIGEHDFTSFCRKPKVADGRARAVAGPDRAVDAAGPSSTTPPICGSRSGPRRSATRWCARSSARWSTSGSARRLAGRRARHPPAPATAAPPARSPRPHGLVLWEVGYP